MNLTLEEIVEARTTARNYVDASRLIGDDSRLAKALQVLLAATEPLEHARNVVALEKEFAEGRSVEI